MDVSGAERVGGKGEEEGPAETAGWEKVSSSAAIMLAPTSPVGVVTGVSNYVMLYRFHSRPIDRLVHVARLFSLLSRSSCRPR